MVTEQNKIPEAVKAGRITEREQNKINTTTSKTFSEVPSARSNAVSNSRVYFQNPERTPEQNSADDPDFEEEEQLAAELAAEQELNAAQSAGAELYNRGQQFSHPSYLKYSILFFLAAIVDIVDLVDLTGIGAVIGRPVSFLFSTLILFIFWFTNTEQKRVDGYVDNIRKNLEFLTQRIASAEKNLVRFARLSRKIPGAKQAYRRLHLKTVRRARIALRKITKSTKSPIVRSLAAGVINLIPFLATIPWVSVGIWLSYRAESESYRNAREASNSVLETLEGSSGET